MCVKFVAGRDGADALYTEAVHELYLASFERARQRLEKLPPQLLPEIARQLPDETFFMYVYQGPRVVAFSVCVVGGATYHGLYAGIDHELNSVYDLYFNMFYHVVDHALKQGVTTLALGQTADTFKRHKLACNQVPLYSYVKGANPLCLSVVRGRQVRTTVHTRAPP
ncbi:MAG: hypothetical protein CMJ48_02795, partial [Planctomycetaceae bacterium]|nr:hypothetical protein [Planctomycetaceae bacterium]